MSKKKSILRLLIPTAVCSFMFVSLLSGVISSTSIREVHATASNVVWQGEESYVQINSSDLPEENPMEVLIEFTESDAATIYNSLGDEIIKVQKNNPGVVTFSNEQWASIKSDSYIEIWPEGKSSITKVSYVIAPDHTHGTGSDALGFYNWDGGAGHNSMPLEEGSYCLTSDIELQNGWGVPEGTTNLCLNGHNIKITAPDDNVICITEGATLNLYDCDTHYQFFEDIDGLWSLKAEQDVPTDYAINGGCIMGATASDDTKNASGVYCSGTFNMYGGNIVGNKATSGGGVNNVGTFNMYGGNISGNLATDSGGGLYTASSAVSILTGGTITQNTATNDGAGVYYQKEACFVAGTQITMADGSKKAIEDLAVGDSVRVFDHNSGSISSSNLFDVGAMFEQQSGVVNLHFTSEIDLSVVYGHSFFEREANKYVPVTKDTVSNYVGHQFYNADNACWETLTGYDFVDGEVDTYIIASEYNLNCVANGMLSVEDGFYTALSNTFEFGGNLTIDAIKKAQDIEKYGIYDFENINYVNKHTYDALGLENLNVTVGKGLFSKDYFEYLAMVLSEVDPEIYCDIEESEPVSKSMPRRITRTETPVQETTAAGLYVGGSIQIIGNEEQNLYLPSGAMVNIGTGNGIPAPTENMLIGITSGSGAGAFTSTGVEDYSENFFSDDENYAVRLIKGTDEAPGDYLALETLLTIANNNPKTSKDTYNGYIELPASAVAGDEVSVTVVPNDGYKLASLKYNDGENDYDIEDLSFEMPDGDVSVSAVFEAKAGQVVTIVLDEEFIYPNTPSIQEAGLYVYSNYYEKLGDGEVTVEYKPKGADDSEYTTQVPIQFGEYTVRVSVAEGTDYLAGFATKDFTYSPQVITQVGFGSLGQPVAGAVAPEKTTSMLVNTKYHETVTWDPEITTTNADGKGIFDCGTTYTAKVTLTLKDDYKDNYVFADPEHIVLKGAGTGWTLSDDSTNKTLIYTKEFKATDDHSVNKVSGTVTCTTAGYKDAYLCENCGLYFEDEACTKEIGDVNAYALWKEGDGKSSALGHDMTHHEAVAPTCTDDGNVEYWTCSRDGEVYYANAQGTATLDTIVDSKTGHDMTYHEAVAPTCTEDGTIAYWTCSHEPGVYYANEEGTETLENIVDPMVGHDMTYHEAVAPTCTEDGTVEYWTCSRDGDVYYADAQGTETLSSIVDTKLGHDLIHHDGKEPTCTEAGWEAYDTCSRCDYSTYVEIPALGHSMTHHDAVAPTCTDDGNVEYWSCSHEPDVYYADAQGTATLASIVDTKIGHDLIHHDAKAPTCTEAGWEAYDTCSRCDYSTYVEIPALGHEAPLVEGLDPTYENDGYKPAYKCSACGEYFEDQACTKLIGDEAAYNAWKANAGHLDKLVKEAEEPAKDNTGLIVGLVVGGFFLLLLIIYLLGYFFLYRKGKLDERKIKVIYKILPRGNKNLKEDSQEQKENK